MDIEQLADELRKMYDTAPRGEQVTRIHLFGIKYAAELGRFAPASVAERAGIGRSYGTEINKGRNLAKYVELKPLEQRNDRRRFLS